MFWLGCTSVGALAGFLDTPSSMVSFNDYISEQVESVEQECLFPE
jgi:hypothetical protein